MRRSNNSNKAQQGHWTDEQKIKYGLFIRQHESKLRTTQSRRLWKVFLKMSQFLQTRQSTQCRTYHHKMELCFKSVSGILKHLNQTIHNFNQRAQQFRPTLSTINFGINILSSKQQHYKNNHNQQSLQESHSKIIFQNNNNNSINQIPVIQIQNQHHSPIQRAQIIDHPPIQTHSQAQVQSAESNSSKYTSFRPVAPSIPQQISHAAFYPPQSSQFINQIFIPIYPVFQTNNNTSQIQSIIWTPFNYFYFNTQQ